MADTKISALPASTTPLAGTEVLPIVQSSATKQVSVANLTAGRAISATELTLTTGNLIVASGQGVDFSATAGTGTSELLADYEEGTWTPSLGGTTTYAEQTGQYTKVGRLVNVRCCVSVTLLGTGSNSTISGLPFTSFTTASGNPTASISVGFFDSLALSTTYISGFIPSNNTTIVLTGTTIPGTSATAFRQTFGNGARVDLTATYFV